MCPRSGNRSMGFSPFSARLHVRPPGSPPPAAAPWVSGGRARRRSAGRSSYPLSASSSASSGTSSAIVRVAVRSNSTPASRGRSPSTRATRRRSAGAASRPGCRRSSSSPPLWPRGRLPREALLAGRPGRGFGRGHKLPARLPRVRQLDRPHQALLLERLQQHGAGPQETTRPRRHPLRQDHQQRDLRRRRVQGGDDGRPGAPGYPQAR